MQLRFLFHELQRRIRRHQNYRRVVSSMEARLVAMRLAPNVSCISCNCLLGLGKGKGTHTHGRA